MKFSVGIILICAILISGCRLQDTSNKNPYDGWTYACFEPEKTASGTVRGERKCVLDYQIPSELSEPLSLPAVSGRSSLIIADSSGRRVRPPSAMPTCDNRPRHHGVDGVSFIGLSFSRQVQLLSTGRVYVSHPGR